MTVRRTGCRFSQRILVWNNFKKLDRESGININKGEINFILSVENLANILEKETGLVCLSENIAFCAAGEAEMPYEYVWKWDAEGSRRGYIACRFYYKKMLKIIAANLNILHGEKHREKYWEILIGPWLVFFVHIFYERYISLRAAAAKYPSGLLPEREKAGHYITLDTIGFVNGMKTALLNEQAYHDIWDFIHEKNSSHDDIKKIAVPGRCLSQEIFRRLLNKAIRYAPTARKKIILADFYLPKRYQYLFFLRSAFKIKPFLEVNNNFEPVLSVSERRKLADRKNANNAVKNGFLEIMSSLWPYYIPACFVEGYTKIKKQAAAIYPKADYVCSSVGWYYNEMFKAYAAEAGENSAELIASQHGGDYGSELFRAEYELAITDRFYSWGWGGNEPSGKCRPFWAPKLAGRKAFSSKEKAEGLLFVGTDMPLYQQMFLTGPHFPDYLLRQWDFFSELSPDIRKVTAFRPHYEDSGWNTVQRVKRNFPEVSVDKKKSLLSAFRGCRVIVIGYLGTTFLEALVSGRPTVLFWDDDYAYTEEAGPYYDKLKSVGILHNSAASAARHINDNYDNIEIWWDSQTVQSVLHDFTEAFARNCPDAAGEWYKELNICMERDMD